MSLLTIVQDIALDVGLYGQALPTSFSGATDRDSLELMNFINKAGEEVARRVDWTALRNSITLNGNGLPITFALPSDFSRLISGKAVSADGQAVRGGLSEDEWADLPVSQGRPRFYKLSGKTIQFYPSLAFGSTVKVIYQSSNWNGSKAVFQFDGETALIPEIVISKVAIARWRRQKGMTYDSYAAEAEQVMRDYADFDEGIRSP